MHSNQAKNSVLEAILAFDITYWARKGNWCMSAIIYLAGPIMSVDRAAADCWRKEAEWELNKLGYSALTPLHRVGLPAKQIVDEDIKDIRLATAVIAYMPLTIVSVGTPMEVFYAHCILGKPVLVWGHERSKTSPWIAVNSDGIFETLADLIEYIRQNPKCVGKV